MQAPEERPAQQESMNAVDVSKKVALQPNVQEHHLCVGGDVLEAAAQDAERLLRAEALHIG